MTIYAHAFWAWYPFRQRDWVGFLTLGAVLPDLPYVAVFAWTALSAGPGALGDLHLWESLWGSPLVAALHSFVPWLAASAILAPWLVRSRWARPGVALLAGWLLHVVVDALTHRSDGYLIYYPLSDYRFPTPVSYWEPAYHGVTFAIACDSLIALAVVRLAWQRARRRRVEVSGEAEPTGGSA
jgi:hypothetical protein